MKSKSSIFAGTALGLLLAATPALAGGLAATRMPADAPILLAQAEQPQGDEERVKKLMEQKKAKQDAKKSEKAEKQAPKDEQPEARKQETRQAPKQAEKSEPRQAEKSQPKEQQASKPGADREAETQRKAGQKEQAPAEAADQDRKQRGKEENAERGKAAEGNSAKAEKGEAATRTEEKAGQQQDNGQAKSEEAAQEKRGKNTGKAGGEESGKAAEREDKAATDEADKARENKAESGKAAEEPEARQPAENAEDTGKAKADQAERNKERPKNAENARNPETQPGGASGQASQGEEAPQSGQEAQGGEAAQGGGNVVLPKSLNGQRAEGRKRRNAEGRNENADSGRLPDSARGRNGQRRQQADRGEARPLPDSDAAAQSEITERTEIQSITAVEGRRVDKPERVYREAPDNVKVVKKVDNRTIVELGDQIFVRGSDRPRITRHARDVYYEDLPRHRTRETVIRPNGVRVVTIRNEYGDVIRRSKFTHDNREIVLVYVGDRYLDHDDGWGDVGADLPPLVVDVPDNDYVLDAEQIDDPDRYYTFLEQPPVEPVQRIYTIGEVKRSARIRDIMPRIDLDTITFDFGSAEIGQDQAGELQGLAQAINRILDDNPAETFLIEGHTDAVGSDQANLVLSDQRADSVASALTQMFEIPPENLSTQGYGEEYLKVDTQEANRENRRVTVRRITPLVAPVAQAQ